jgi:molecular chaperone DnaK (HSP70)
VGSSFKSAQALPRARPLQLKKVLSANSEAPINVESLQNDVDAHGEMTRDKFEELAQPVLERLLSPIQKVLLLVSLGGAGG